LSLIAPARDRLSVLPTRPFFRPAVPIAPALRVGSESQLRPPGNPLERGNPGLGFLRLGRSDKPRPASPGPPSSGGAWECFGSGVTVSNTGLGFSWGERTEEAPAPPDRNRGGTRTAPGSLSTTRTQGPAPHQKNGEETLPAFEDTRYPHRWPQKSEILDSYTGKSSNHGSRTQKRGCSPAHGKGSRLWVENLIDVGPTTRGK
jgi:hypothetical protein